MTFEKDLVVREHNRLLAVALVSGTVALLGAYFGGVDAADTFFTGPVFGLAVGFGFGMWSMKFGGKKHRRRVAASRDGVSIDGKLVVPSADIRSARFIPDAKQPIVRLGGRHARALFVVQVDNQEEGLRLIEAVGHDPANRKERFRIMSDKPLRDGALAGTTAIIMTVCGIAALMATGIRLPPHAMTLVVLLASVPPLAFVVLRSPMAEIGVDGVLITSGRKKTWVPFADVHSIEKHDGTVRFRLSDRRCVDVRLFDRSITVVTKAMVNVRDAFLVRAREALAAHRASSGPRELAATLARADRDKDEWLTTLRQLRDGEAGYRSSPMRDEDLWRVVEDPGAPEDARAAAAFILRRPGEETAPAERLRVAAQAVAAPRLRIALESDDEDALEAYCAEPSAKRASA